MLLGLTRCFGVAMTPAFRAPLCADGVADWWRRYNIHFRELLVDLFWYPVAMRFRRRPIVAGYVGSRQYDGPETVEALRELARR